MKAVLMTYKNNIIREPTRLTVTTLAIINLEDVTEESLCPSLCLTGFTELTRDRYRQEIEVKIGCELHQRHQSVEVLK